jgi:hypothetical protein
LAGQAAKAAADAQAALSVDANALLAGGHVSESQPVVPHVAESPSANEFIESRRNQALGSHRHLRGTLVGYLKTRFIARSGRILPTGSTTLRGLRRLARACARLQMHHQLYLIAIPPFAAFDRIQ